MVGAFREQLPPVRDDSRIVAVDLEPGERLRQRRPVEQRTLRAWWRLQIHETGNQAEHLLKPLDVTPGDRQQAELDAALEWIRREALTPSDQAERL